MADKQDFISKAEIKKTLREFNLQLSEAEAEKMFEHLDKAGKGVISTNDFIECIVKSGDDPESSLFNRINRSLQTPSEIIIEKLQTIRNHAVLENESEVQDEIDWIVKKIINTNIYETDYDEVVKRNSEFASNSSSMGYIFNFINKTKVAKDDLELISKKNPIALSFNLKEMSKSPKLTMGFKKKRSSLISADSVEDLSNLYEMLDLRSTEDFNIRTFLEYTKKNCLTVLGIDLLTQISEGEKQIDSKVLLKFLGMVQNGYSREVYYHNVNV